MVIRMCPVGQELNRIVFSDKTLLSFYSPMMDEEEFFNSLKNWPTLNSVQEHRVDVAVSYSFFSTSN